MMQTIIIYAFAASRPRRHREPTRSCCRRLIVGVTVNLAGAYLVGGDLQLAVAFLIIVAVLVVRRKGCSGAQPSGGSEEWCRESAAPPSLLACAGCRGSPARPSHICHELPEQPVDAGAHLHYRDHGLERPGRLQRADLAWPRSFYGSPVPMQARSSSLAITSTTFVTIPIAGLITGVIGFILGIPALRLSAL